MQKTKPYSKYDSLPKGLVEAPWSVFHLDGPRKTLILSDVHIPFQDDAALHAALEYGQAEKANTIILNGDIADCYSGSKFEQDPLLRLDLPEEREWTCAFLSDLRKRFPRAEIVYKLGNHEERFERCVRERNRELYGSPELMFENYFRLSAFKIKVVKDKNEIRLGRLSVFHGHEWGGTYGSPVNPARGLYNKMKVNAIAGHLHQTSQQSETNGHKEVISTWSTGCLCNLAPQYARMNKWNLGFAFVTTDKQGIFEVQNLRIINGEVY